MTADSTHLVRILPEGDQWLWMLIQANGVIVAQGFCLTREDAIDKGVEAGHAIGLRTIWWDEAGGKAHMGKA